MYSYITAEPYQMAHKKCVSSKLLLFLELKGIMSFIIRVELIIDNRIMFCFKLISELLIMLTSYNVNLNCNFYTE